MIAQFQRYGSSSIAEGLARQLQGYRRKLAGAPAMGDKVSLYDELAEVWEQCRETDWDGFGAGPIVQDTLRNTYRALESLPLGFPSPSIGAEPDGHLTLEWHRSPTRTLSVSIGPDGDLHYAAMLGTSRSWGTEPLIDRLPRAIVELVGRVLSV